MDSIRKRDVSAHNNNVIWRDKIVQDERFSRYYGVQTNIVMSLGKLPSMLFYLQQLSSIIEAFKIIFWKNQRAQLTWHIELLFNDRADAIN